MISRKGFEKIHFYEILSSYLLLHMHPWFCCSSSQEKSSLAQKNLLLPEKEYELLNQQLQNTSSSLFWEGPKKQPQPGPDWNPSIPMEKLFKMRCEPRVWQPKALGKLLPHYAVKMKLTLKYWCRLSEAARKLIWDSPQDSQPLEFYFLGLLQHCN